MTRRPGIAQQWQIRMNELYHELKWMTGVWTCRRCGSLVTDKTAHTLFHMDRQIALQKFHETVLTLWGPNA